MLKQKRSHTNTILDRPYRKVVLVGRGSKLSKSIASEILSLTGLDRHIKVLLIPSAANNSTTYRKCVNETTKIFSHLGAHVDVLHGDPTANNFHDPTRKRIEHMIAKANVLWISGGNTTQARNLFERTGLGYFIKHSTGKVIAGGSAGALELADKDALSFSTPERLPEENDWIDERGIGIFKPVIGVHNDFIEHLPWKGGILSKPRSFYHKKMLKKLLTRSSHRRFGVCIDDASALVIHNDSFKVVNADDADSHAGVTTYRLLDDKLIESHFTPKNTVNFIPLDQLRPAA